MTVHGNKNYARGDARLADPRVALLKELADPIRLRVIDRLTNAGPCHRHAAGRGAGRGAPAALQPSAPPAQRQARAPPSVMGAR